MSRTFDEMAARLREREGLATGDAAPLPAMAMAPRRRAEGAAGAAAAAAQRMTRAIPERFRECADLKTARARLAYDPSSVLGAAAGILADRVRTVTFYGPSAAGKTSGAALLVGELARGLERGAAHRPVSWWETFVWCSAHDLAHEADHTDPRLGEPDIAGRARTAHVLVLDDLGNEKGRLTGSNNVPAGILQLRYDAPERLVTIVTTGLGSDEMERRYGVGLARRLADERDPSHLLVGGAS